MLQNGDEFSYCALASGFLDLVNLDLRDSLDLLQSAFRGTYNLLQVLISDVVPAESAKRTSITQIPAALSLIMSEALISGSKSQF